MDGVAVWEPSPVLRHQDLIDTIRASIHRGSHLATSSGCRCIHKSDIEVLFPDGSRKRPDIAIFRRWPDELDSAVTLIPEAVIEVLSLGYEWKDEKLAKPFYVRLGVKDVVIVDPRTGSVSHAWRDAERILQSPVTIALECGCQLTIPDVTIRPQDRERQS